MSQSGLLSVSLAAKCRLMFGLAVVLILASALFVPWYSLENLVHDRNLQRARSLALLGQALLDPTSPNWSQQQARLDQWWSDNLKPLRLPEQRPRFVLLPTGGESTMDRESVAAGLAAAARAVTSSFEAIRRHVLPPLPRDVAAGLWARVSEQQRERVVFAGQAALQRIVRAWGPSPYHLDTFQRKCAQAMLADEALHEMHQTEHRAGRPPTYRYVLAARGEDAGSGRRPLLGLVDMRLPVPGTDQALLWIRVIIVMAGLLAGFLAILVFYFIVQKFILAPVRELTVLAEDIAGGNLSARASIATGDEFEDLAHAFNDMLGRLERARVELETINRSLDTRLGELAETNVALFEANRLKSEFLANVSHELRTPLTSIIGFADLLRDLGQSEGDVDRTRFTRYAHHILTSGRMLLDLINDLLDLAKIEAGKVELHRTRFAVADIAEALRDFVRPLTDKKRIALTLDLDEDLPMMHSDAGKVRQVLYNLLSNAIKYTPEGGTIRIEARAGDAGRRVQLAVADTGPGIAPEDQARIFEKFRQLDASVTREHGGSGLGLAISKELTSLLGGTIRVESEESKGSRFLVVLPVECPETVHRPRPALT